MLAGEGISTVREENTDGVRYRAFLPWRNEGTIRSNTHSGAPQQTCPTERPDLPRSRPVSWWLDNHCCPRLQGELGALPGRHPHASPQTGRERGIHHAAAGTSL